MLDLFNCVTVVWEWLFTARFFYYLPYLLNFRDLQKDQTVLLLYTMLHRNESFLQHVLQREDLESLVSHFKLLHQFTSSS